MIDRPWKTGKFLISAGLKPLGDRPIFEREKDLDVYLINKVITRQENLLKAYPQSVGLSDQELKLIASFIRAQLNKDLPERSFDLDVGEARDEIDTLITQVPEDFAVWKMEGEEDWMALIHLCSPNHWDARKKIGKTFLDSHSSIPHIEPITRAAPKMFKQIQKRGAMERFAWGVSTDNRLNHHPEPPPGIDAQEWRGRSFDEQNPILFIRQERQTLFSINSEMIGLTIKTGFYNVRDLSAEDLALVHQSIKSMDEAVLKYKGLHSDKNSILRWLAELILSSMSTVNLPPHDDRQVEQFL